MMMFRIAASLVVLALPAQAGEQTRLYGPDGRSVGTAAPDSAGSTRYYDASGRSLGTSTTTGGTTTFYDARGNITGKATAPAKR
ncbi:YD repeat-containing protein [Bradyrhizobium barranii subsp. barranii]|uniref:hypothetical protein n=1 Tax=Bradyrhizobium TaxID=374 RepID=UPI001BAA8180|nr:MULTISPECIES: hypothetical protein [Bradyrhizobium]MBR0883887.1 hypothetical protein [Bradyrhizobium liaoningense]MCP1778879.1 YD repeat-containing protein [Bradyrhizobium japonicum]MCP1958124.1 YD repeat-containing protein [Bradyrhizobium japonicum]